MRLTDSIEPARVNFEVAALASVSRFQFACAVWVGVPLLHTVKPNVVPSYPSQKPLPDAESNRPIRCTALAMPAENAAVNKQYISLPARYLVTRGAVVATTDPLVFVPAEKSAPPTLAAAVPPFAVVTVTSVEGVPL